MLPIGAHHTLARLFHLQSPFLHPPKRAHICIKLLDAPLQARRQHVLLHPALHALRPGRRLRWQGGPDETPTNLSGTQAVRKDTSACLIEMQRRARYTRAEVLLRSAPEQPPTCILLRKACTRRALRLECCSSSLHGL